SGGPAGGPERPGVPGPHPAAAARRTARTTKPVRERMMPPPGWLPPVVRRLATANLVIVSMTDRDLCRWMGLGSGPVAQGDVVSYPTTPPGTPAPLEPLGRPSPPVAAQLNGPGSLPMALPTWP